MGSEPTKSHLKQKSHGLSGLKQEEAMLLAVFIPERNKRATEFAVLY